MIQDVYFTLPIIVYLYYLYHFYPNKGIKTFTFLSLIIIGSNFLLAFYDYYHIAFISNFIILFIYQLFVKIKREIFILYLSLLSYILSIIIYYFLLNLYELQLVLIIHYQFTLFTVFFLLHLVKNKVSISFHLLFYLSLVTVSIISILNRNQYNYLYYALSTIVFFLSENNQRFMKKDYEQKVIEYQNKILQHQVDEVQSIYSTMRGWRHDYHNHLQTLKAHFALKKFGLASDYLNALENDLDSIDHLVQSGNMTLDAILNSKLSLAKAKSIDINFKAVVPEQLLISEIDLCVVIGNLLDNAIEACEIMNEKENRFIRVYIGIFKKQLYISVTNSTKELVRKLDEDYITNKRGNHGHGLKRIDLVVKKYDGFINRKNEPGVFVTEIMLPL